MKRLVTLAAVAAAALSTAACVTVIDGGSDHDFGWRGHDAQPFDASLAAGRAQAGRDRHGEALRACMAEKGWTATR